MSEVAETIALIRDRVATPLIVDADTGYGNALNVAAHRARCSSAPAPARSSSRTRISPSAAAISTTRR